MIKPLRAAAALLLLGTAPLLAQSATISVGGTGILTNQVSVAATATQVAPARPGRIAVFFFYKGTTEFYIGNSGVTATTGALLPGVLGASLTLPTSAAVSGITASGSQTVSYIETF